MTAQFKEVARDIYWLKGSIPGLTGIFSAYIVKGENNVLIEPGPATLIPAIQEAAKNISVNSFSHIIPTHIHLDHAGALGKLSRLYPDAKIVVNAVSPKHLIDPSRLIQSTKMAFGDDYALKYGAIEPVPESKIKIVKDGDKISVGDRDLTIIDAPGHASHHIVILDAMTGGLFCGEALGLIYNEGIQPLPAVAPPGFDEVLYIETMKRLQKLKPKLLFYSHDGVGYEPETQISQAIKNSIEFGQAILHALKKGETEDAIIESMGDYVLEHFGARLDAYDLASNVKGYVFYYNRKGII
jgi:glyoxylase-like metal-dependent hydrolase (beta-lactamase superfamily II)